VRQVLGDFGVSDLSKLKGGKVIVGTDENGVPNERSASVLGQHLGDLAQTHTFAPLHIQRWDNVLFNKHKELIIMDVEVNVICTMLESTLLFVPIINYLLFLCTVKICLS